MPFAFPDTVKKIQSIEGKLKLTHAEVVSDIQGKGYALKYYPLAM